MDNAYRLSVFTIVLLIVSVSVFSRDFVEKSDTIRSDEIWSADTVKVIGDIHVADDITLIINPGTYVEFQGPYMLDIQGTLIARGAPGDSIVFTATDTSYFYNPDSMNTGWHGIRFDNGEDTEMVMADNDSSVIDHCIIEFCKKNRYGTIYINNFSRIKISNNHFRVNWSGMYGGAIYTEFSELDINNNLFNRNYAKSQGGAIVSKGSEINLNNNIFTLNESYSGGVVSSVTNSILNISNNIFSNNRATGYGGISYFLDSDISLQNNLIVNNYGKYGIIYSYTSGIAMTNSTICNNYNSFHGTIALTNSFADIYNSIFRGNASPDSSLIRPGLNGSVNVYYSNLQGGQEKINNGSPYEGTYMHNIDQDPEFIDPTDTTGLEANGLEGDWTISTTSPCFNGGTPPGFTDLITETDLSGNYRVLNGRIDMGAYEYHFTSMDVCGSVSEDTNWVADTVKINCDVMIEDDITLTIHPGTVIQVQGPYNIEVVGTLLSRGTEKDMIIFTVDDTTNFKDTSTVDGGWCGIRLEDHSDLFDNDTSVLDFTTVEYVKNLDYGDHGGIYISYHSRIKLLNSIIRNCYAISSGGGIYCEGSQIVLKNCIFENNTAGSGGAMYIKNSNNFTIENSLFKNNTSRYSGGAIYANSAKSYIANCQFYNNFAAEHGGGLNLSEDEVTLSHCRIINNIAMKEGGGIALWMVSGKSSISNTLISNNTSPAGGAVKTWGNTNPGFINTTIVNNSSGFYLDESSPAILNSISWGNGDYEIYIHDNFSAPVIKNSNIQNDTSGFILNEGVSFRGQYLNNIDTVPLFLNPSDGPGADFDGLVADWQLSPLSPCINRGDNSFYELSEYDLGYGPRINKEIVDLGAYENQDDKPTIVYQPANISACLNDSVSFSIETDGPANFTWFMDGTELPDENSPALVLPSVEYIHDGSYHCIVSNAYDQASSNTVLLIVKSEPQIISQSHSEWIIPDRKKELQILATGAQPIHYQWMKDEELLTGKQDLTLILDSFNLADEGQYRCILSNKCGETSSDPINLWMAPQICMVTVSTITVNNLVVWEKNSSAPIAAYNIYRESAFAGIYDRLATVDADDLSIFIDTTAYPTIQAYFYKITAIDTSGNETPLDLCTSHKTVHLLVTTNPENNSTQLDWDRYIGFEYGTYIIYKSITGVGFDQVHEMASSSSTWTEQMPSLSKAYYRVAAVRNVPCIPTGKLKNASADTGPYSHSMSNVDENRLQTDVESFSISENGLLVYPNPFSDRTMLQFPNPYHTEYRITVRDLSGRTVMIINNVTSDRAILERNRLRAGCYSIEVSGENVFRSKVVIE